jgi:hypothetical protein
MCTVQLAPAFINAGEDNVHGHANLVINVTTNNVFCPMKKIMGIY